MKSVLISIQPKWCELIASGKKTIEVRKTNPKLDTPFKVYIYQTQGKYEDLRDCRTFKFWDIRQKVIGEFVCDEIIEILPDNEIYSIYDISDDEVIASCLVNGDLWDYGKGKTIYGWHISNLVIYDKPKELSEFHTVDKDAVRSCGHRHQSYCSAQCDSGYIKNGFYCDRTADWCTQCTTKPITRAPQSWCFVEELRP